MTKITLSSLPHTWLIDLDGTVVEHNGHKNGAEKLLEGVADLWAQIPATDTIILLSARTEDELQSAFNLLAQHGLRYDRALCHLPVGERVLVNDTKPRGLTTAFAINVPRDRGLTEISIEIDPAL